MALNKRAVPMSQRLAVRNHEGGVSFDIRDPFTVLQVAATSCFFGEPAYYVAGDSAPAGNARRSSYNPFSYYTGTADWGTPLIDTEAKNTRQLMEDAIDRALDADIERTLQFAVELRNEWYIRATPQVIMVRAAMHPAIKDTGLIGKYAPRIMSRLDEVMSQMAYFESVQGSLKRIPSRLKRAWSQRLAAADEYQLAKYKMASRNVNIFDAVRLTHPSSPAIDKLIAGEVSLTNENTRTWESIRSGGGTWQEALQVMGHMALLRNLRNLQEDGAITPEVLARLVDGVEKGKQLPFRYYSAFRAVEPQRNGKLIDAIEECLERSVSFTLPRFTGRGLSIVDVSGSMDSPLSANSTMRYSDVSRLMGIMAAKTHEDGADLLMFGTNTKKFEMRRKSAIFDEMRRINGNHGCGHGTNITGAFERVIRDGDSYDVIWVFSDMQCGYQGDVPTLLNRYRAQVNPNTQVFFVNLAGYHDSLVPEFYDRTYLLGGWSDKVLQFADKIIGITADR